MTDHDDRTQELIAAAAAGDLTAAEREEFDALRAQDPSIDQTLQEFSAMLPGIQRAAHHWQEGTPSADLEQAVLQLPHTEGSSEAREAQAVSADSRRRRRAGFALAAAGCVIAGGGMTLVIQHLLDAPPEGPPGTYGAVEEVSFDGEPTGVTVDGSLIAHTWGTETVLEIDGLDAEESFSVILVAEDGQEFASGTFFGSELLIECRMNAAIMRDEVTRVEIAAEDGDLIARADLPEAIDPENEDPEED